MKNGGHKLSKSSITQRQIVRFRSHLVGPIGYSLSTWHPM